MTEKTIDVEAEVIETPATLTEADRWLAEQRERVEARAKDFEAFEIATPEQYRDAKAQRKALRALIAEVDGDKKRMTKQLRDTLNRFNSEVSGILAGLQEEDAQYKSELDRWERQVVVERDARVEARYRDEWPDLAAQVPYQRLRERYGADWKADNFGTKEAAIWARLAEAVEGKNGDGGIVADVETIRAQTHINGIALTDEDRADLLAEYLRTLDMASALHMMRQRVEQREALMRAEEERRAWEAEQAARQAAIEYDAAESPEPTAAPVAPEGATAASGQAPAQDREAVYVYEVSVPERVKPDFVATMKRLGTHGRLLRKE